MTRGAEGGLPADFISTRRTQISQDIEKVWNLRADLEERQGIPFVIKAKIGPGTTVDESYIRRIEDGVFWQINDLRKRGFVHESEELMRIARPPKPQSDPLDAFLKNNKKSKE